MVGLWHGPDHGPRSREKWCVFGGEGRKRGEGDEVWVWVM